MNNMRIAKDFFKHVPMEKQAIVREKLDKFTKMISDANVFHEIPKGFWIRKIIGTNIYKFRINSGDRILFTFQDDHTITYLSFETHDNQIQAAKRMNKEEFVEYVVDETPYEEECIDENINRYALQELVSKLTVISQQDIMDDEYVAFLLEDDELFNSEQILTREQFEALNTPNKLTVVFGCAGSGKTNIGIRRLLLHQELGIETYYVSHSPYLMNEIRTQFLKRTETEGLVQFFSLYKFYEHILKHTFTIITKDDFVFWFKENSLQSKLNPEELFMEINTVIKGRTLNIMMTQEEYNNYPSDFSLQDKRSIYFLANLYHRWLEKNQYVDLNDLAYMILIGEGNKIESIVFDEIQELTTKQFESLIHLSKNPKNHLLLGDPFQAIDNYAFETDGVLKLLSRHGIPFQKYVLNKNFRSGFQMVQLLNHIKDQEKNYYSTKNSMDEAAVRSTSIPKLIIQKEFTDVLLQKLDQDANSIIIVADQATKEKLQKKDFQRVFIVSEVQGLQYKTVYCQNILQNFSIVERHNLQLYKTYFHSMYIAASRASQNIYFLEDHNLRSIKLDLFEQYDYRELVELEYDIASNDEWMDEARKLELLGKFEQALHAYKKAQNQNGVKRCQALLMRTKNYQHLDQYLSVMHFNFDIKGPEQIECALQQLMNQHIKMIGRTTYTIAQSNDGNINFNPLFIDQDMSIEHISQELYRRIDYNYAAKYTLNLAGVFYQENEPIFLSDKFGYDNHNDILFTEKNGVIQYRTAQLVDSRAKLKQYFDFEKQKQPAVSEVLEGFNPDVVIENAPEKETADDHLKYIFG